MVLATWILLRARHTATITLTHDGVKGSFGVIPYSQFTTLRASFVYRRVTMVRNNALQNNPVLRFEGGHAGRTKLYAISAATNIPVQEDDGSSAIREPKGQRVDDPRSDLQQELARQSATGSYLFGLNVKRTENTLSIATPLWTGEKLVAQLLSLTALGVGLLLLSVFLRHIKIVDQWAYDLGLAVPGSTITLLACGLILGYSIVEELTEQVSLFLRGEQMTIDQRRGLSHKKTVVQIDDIHSVVVQQVGWTEGLRRKAKYDCLILTQQQTIELQAGTRYCRQIRGLLGEYIGKSARR